MNNVLKKLTPGFALLLALCGGTEGATTGADTASNSVYATGWTNGMNGGSGFSAWQLAVGGSGGLFTASSTTNAGGTSGGIDSGGRSWGLWSTSGVTEAVRPLSGTLSTGQVLRLSFDNGWINSGKSAGIAFRNAASNNLWEFYFSGGESYYSINDQAGTSASTVPYTGDGLQIAFQMVGTTSYLANVTIGTSVWRLAGALISQTDSGIAQIRCWNYEAGSGSSYDVFLNNLSVTNGSLLDTNVSVAVAGQILISEIHYHPVEEPVFNSDGTPFLQLTNDVHEFVEIQNTGVAAVDLGGWTLAGGISYTFPLNTVIPAGGYRVVAKNPARLAAVYSLGAPTVLGPYKGALGNNSDTVRLRDSSGTTVDAVTYDAQFPWAQAADALGAQDRFSGLISTNYQYKGRSLQRVSTSWSSGDPANWLASPLTGPTPGTAQAVTRTVPKPVVIAQSAVQATDGSVIIRSNTAVTVNCEFSATNTLSAVTLEYFVDDINSYTETKTSVTMSSLGAGTYVASIPGQTNRAVVRYRFKANRGDGLEVVSPRSDDPQIAPIGTNGTREAWFGYFVTPVRASSNPVYDVFVPTTALATMNTNITQSPVRVTAASASGMPRACPFVATNAPQWDGTLPGVFACSGQVWDIQIRYHGSRYHRAAANNSFKLHFPDHQPFDDQASWFITGHSNEFVEAQRLNRMIGLPASKMFWVDWYYNSNSMIARTQQGEYAKEMLEDYHELQQQLNPGSDKEAVGELYKDVGNRDASQNNNEGPYTRGDEAPMLANATWTQLQRYDWTMSLQTHDWIGSKPVCDLIEGMWTARGDTPSTHNFTNSSTQLASARAWFTNNWDMDTLLTSMALLEWMSIWDDAAQNHYFWRRENGKWVRLGWDYDSVMSTTSSGGGGGGGAMGGTTNQTIYGGEVGATVVFDGSNWWKDTFFKCFRSEYNQRLWEINNSFCDPTNLTALGFTNAATFAAKRQSYVNSQLSALGTYYKPVRATNATPASGATVVGTTSLTTRAYVHPTAIAHASTKWEIRTAAGNYEEPVLRLVSTTYKTNMPMPYDQLTYGQTYYWRATFFDTNGHYSIVSAETSFTWGSTNTSAGNLVLNEILADNRNAVQNDSTLGDYFPDFVELRNNSSSNITLSGYALTDNPEVATKYLFPTGATIAAGAHLVVWCDSDTTASGYHSGFKLDANGDQVLLLSGATVVDSVTFGPQAPDVSIGRIVNGTGGWQANTPTPAAANSAKTLGSVSNLCMNEWMADPAYGDDWFELYNKDTNVVALASLWLSDTPSTPMITQIPALSFIEGNGHSRFWADGSSSGGNHANFKLTKSGESLLLTSANGATTLDTITFGSQTKDISQGRLPDGSNAFVTFSSQTATPNHPNWAPAPVYINEVLAHSASPYEDAVEIYNPTATNVDIGGWWLSDYRPVPQKLQIPAGTTVPAGGYVVFYKTDFQGGSVPFALSGFDDEMVLSAVNSGGALTGYGAYVHFPPSAENVSFGRVAATGLDSDSGGAEMWPLVSHTFGQDNPASVEVFRTGTGATNTTPQTATVILNEIMYRPVDSTNGTDDVRDEFIELHNAGTNAASLSGWRLNGDVEYTFATNTSLPAGGYLLLVGFSPTDTTTLTTFRTNYGLSTNVTVLGPFSTNLPNSTAEIQLEYASTLKGYSTYIFVDRVEYRDITPWATNADGAGSSLQRISASAIGNTAANWNGATPTPAAANNGATVELSISTTSPLAGGVAGTAYSNTFTATGGTAPYSWTITSGSVSGLTLTTNGVYSGTPTTAGSNSFTVKVQDAAGTNTSKVLSLIIAASAPAISTTSPLSTGTVSVAYSNSLAGTGGTTPYSWSLASGTLPTGLTLSATGMIAGTPTAAGSYNFTMRLTDAGGLTATKAFSLAITAFTLSIATPSPLVNAIWNNPYSQAFTASGGSAPYGWSLAGGSLPAGLSLGTDGTLSGTPTNYGTFAFTVQVTDSVSAAATKAFGLTVATPGLVITTESLEDGIVGDAYLQNLTATGGVSTYTWSLSSGSLPAGLALTASGSMTGTPTTVGTATFTVQVHDSATHVATQSLSVVVQASGPLDHFRWDAVPTQAFARCYFAAGLSARDSTERVVAALSSNVPVSAAVGTVRTAPVLFTELCDGAEDQFELQNVSTGAVDTTDWTVLVGDSQTDINTMNPVTYDLPANLAAGALLRVSESTNSAGGRTYFGGDIGWSNATGKAWLMLLDADGVIRDFVPAGWTATELGLLSVEINGDAVPVAGQWTGDGLAAGSRAPDGTTVDSWQRIGTNDTNMATNWAWRHNTDNTDASSFGSTNSGLTLPWADAMQIAVSPASADLSRGQFSGTFTLTQTVAGVHMVATNSARLTGVSSNFNVVNLAASPEFSQLSSGTNETGQMTISGSAGLVYVVEGATNLTNQVVWTPLYTTNPAGSSFSWTYPTTTNIPIRYFRLRTGP